MVSPFFATQAGFSLIDWSIVAGYLLIVITIGLLVSRRRGKDDFFLAGRTMPMWAVAISVLATSQSAATFVGGPQQAYARDLTYLSSNLGALIAVIVVALFFIPAYYRHGVTSVYELIGHRYGGAAQRLASGMFMLGRVFASGARLFIVAIPFSLIAFGDVAPGSLLLAILIIAIGATLYTSIGGIRAVIWTDVLQAALYIGTILFSLWFLWQKMPLGPSEIVSALEATGSAGKLTFIDASLGLGALGNPFNLWAILLGLTLFNMAAFGADQDLTQRMLTCRSARSGAWSVILSNIIGWPVIFLFLLMGLLLFLYYQHPGAIGVAPAAYALDDSRTVFLNFILNEMPVGLRGLMMAGLFAAAMSSMDSALNAMASTTVADFIRPRLARREIDPDRAMRLERMISRAAIVGWAALLAGFAAICVFWQQSSGRTLIAFALGVMVYAYAGLLAVFITAIFTRRGNAASVCAALLTGFTIVAAFEVHDRMNGEALAIAFPWRMLIATLFSFGICCLGRRPDYISLSEPEPAPEPAFDSSITVRGI